MRSTAGTRAAAALGLLAVVALVERAAPQDASHASGAPLRYGFYWVVAEEPAPGSSLWGGGLETHTMACNRAGLVPSARAAVLPLGHSWNVTTATVVTDALGLPAPQLGGCYASDPALRDAVILWRERASEQALAALEDVAGLPRRGSCGHSALSILSLWGFSIETRVWEA